LENFIFTIGEFDFKQVRNIRNYGCIVTYFFL
jgi:hypothetical protein